MELSSRFKTALSLAAGLHAQQRRKVFGEPYVAHLLEVTARALEYGADEDEAIAALLHDAIEDQGGAQTREEIRGRFGDRVVEIVDGCTDTDMHPKPPWRQRKEAHVAHVRTASPSVRLIVACDKIINGWSLVRAHRRVGESVWSHFQGGRDGTLWYYRAMADALQSHGISPWVEELRQVVDCLERLAAE